MAEEPGLKPGWYIHPDMHKTLCFWDGDGWTQQVAPERDMSVWTIASGVALGAVAVAGFSLILAALLGFG